MIHDHPHDIMIMIDHAIIIIIIIIIFIILVILLIIIIIMAELLAVPVSGLTLGICFEHGHDDHIDMIMMIVIALS